MAKSMGEGDLQTPENCKTARRISMKLEIYNNMMGCTSCGKISMGYINVGGLDA